MSDFTVLGPCCRAWKQCAKYCKQWQKTYIWKKPNRPPIFEYSILFEYLIPSSASFHLPDLYSFSRWKQLSIKKVPWFRIPNPLVVRRASHSITSPAPLRDIPPSWGLESPFLASCLRSSFARKNSDTSGLWLNKFQKSSKKVITTWPLLLETVRFDDSSDLKYQKVASSRPVYYSILDPMGQRSQDINIKFPLHKQS